jgi:FkbM family methyltransferase
MLKIIYSVYRYLFARKIFSKLNKLLYNCSIRGLGVYNNENMSVSGEKSFIDKTIKKIASSNKNILAFDIGANKGEYTNLLANEIKNIKIFSFEPHPKTFEVLFNNCKQTNVKLFNCALSSKEGELELFDYESKDGSTHASLNAEIFSTIHNSSVVSHKVNVSTVDIICHQNSITEIDFLKIDVEGYELDVLKGAEKMLQSESIKIIQFEFTQLNTTTRLYFKDFWEMLSDSYNIYRLLPNDLLQIKKYNATMDEIFGYQNFVAIKKGLDYGI